MFLVGLTGSIAVGKSTVSQMFVDLGVPVIDSDLIAREVVEPGTKAWKLIKDHFGRSVLLEDGHLNREALGTIIFNDPVQRRKLNSITHPEIAKAIGWRLCGYLIRGYCFVLLDSPLLFEANTWLMLVHKVIVVSCNEEIQLRRLLARNTNLTVEDGQARIQSQMSQEEKCRRADYIIDNSGPLGQALEQVKSVHHELLKLKTHWKIRIVVGLGVLGFLYLTKTLFTLIKK